MTGTGIISFILIIANLIFSYKGFTNTAFFESYKFEVEKILVNKDYKRLITSGFLHINWIHLIFNMLSLIAFSGIVESYLGGLQFLLIYFASLLGGNLLSLFIHRQHGDYSSVGASGAVCGIIFSSIALFPGIKIGFFIIPVSIQGWIYGLLYILYSIYGVKSKKNNIGHEAHLGGALIGMAVALLMHPDAFAENYLTILLIALPAVIFIYLIIARPQLLLVDNYFYKKHQHYYSVDHKYNVDKRNRQNEIDSILDKINTKGMGSLSKKEKEALKEYSKKIS
jgi:membrane associated rhomboid family serine protease